MTKFASSIVFWSQSWIVTLVGREESQPLVAKSSVTTAWGWSQKRWPGTTSFSATQVSEARLTDTQLAAEEALRRKTKSSQITSSFMTALDVAMHVRVLDCYLSTISSLPVVQMFISLAVLRLPFSLIDRNARNCMVAHDSMKSGNTIINIEKWKQNYTTCWLTLIHMHFFGIAWRICVTFCNKCYFP